MGTAGRGRRRDHHDRVGQGHLRARRHAATTCSSRCPTTSAASRCAAAPGRTSCEECDHGRAEAPATEIPELRVTPDKYLTDRYAGASGDFNPIHIDEEFAKPVGLPGRILHGLWTMAQVARAQTEAAGGPAHAQAPVRAVPRHGRARAGDRRQRRRCARSTDGVAHRRHAWPSRAASRSSATPRPRSPDVRSAARRAPAVDLESRACSSPRQERILCKVVEATPRRASRWPRRPSPPTPSIDAGPSTIRNELALLEEQGLLAHPHMSAGRVPTDAGHR